MEQDIIVTGMILSAAPAGEYDKRLVLLTKERGKITAFAKGARRQNNALLAKTNPFSFGRFMLALGRNTYHMRNAEIDNYFREMADDYERACYGFYFLELTDYYTKEADDELQTLKLLYQSMRALLNPAIPMKLVRYIFELKILVINGEYPRMFQCYLCGKEVKSGYFSVKESGMICDECGQGISDSVRITSSALYTIQYVIASPIEKLYTFVVSKDVLEIFAAVMELYRNHYIEKHFKTLDVLEEKWNEHIIKK